MYCYYLCIFTIFSSAFFKSHLYVPKDNKGKEKVNVFVFLVTQKVIPYGKYAFKYMAEKVCIFLVK